MTTELLPCPFCGGNSYQDHVESRPLFWVECIECGVSGKIGATPGDAIEAWNRRAALAATPDLPPAGFALVPIEPTRAMEDAAIVALGWCPEDVAAAEKDDDERIDLRVTYQAMLAAAPRAPVAQPLSESDIYAALGAVNPSWWDVPGGATMAFARAIERAHGIKGEVAA